MKGKLVYKKLLPSGLNIQPHGGGWAADLGATDSTVAQEPGLGFVYREAALSGAGGQHHGAKGHPLLFHSSLYLTGDTQP